jgi:hypothetical protein
VRQLLEGGEANVRQTMKTPDKYRDEAKHCRDLLNHPIEAEVRIQLRLWAAELDDMAECGTEALEDIARPS